MIKQAAEHARQELERVARESAERIMTLKQEIKQDNRIVADWLLNYDERKRDYLEKQEIILHSTPPEITETGPVTSGYTGDTTGNKGTKLAELERIKKWLEVVEEVERNLPVKLRVVLNLRRDTKEKTGNLRGRPAWIPYVQRQYPIELSKITGQAIDEVFISSPKVFTIMWAEIVDIGARLASKRGLL